ncbi:MAG: hypothetical protein LGB73_00375 [Sulfurovum sp.]|nr:hypothetical protein [Sulfurovum sp.]
MQKYLKLLFIWLLFPFLLLDTIYANACSKVKFDKTQYEVSEDIYANGTTKTVNITIKLSKALNHDARVHYYTEDGTAKAEDGDYVPISNGVVTIAAQTTSATIPIQIWNDSAIEFNEYFFIQLADSSGEICIGDGNRTKIFIKEQTDASVCFEDNFDNGLNGRWKVLSQSNLPSGSQEYSPRVVNVHGENRLRLTPADYKIASAITRNYKFSTHQNLIIIEFDYYAYGGTDSWSRNGADGIASILYDSKVGGESPEPGAMGGSLGYAQKDAFSDGAHVGFQGGWLGLGLDEYGNYSSSGEGRNGGVGFRPGAVAIRGDGNYSYGTPSVYRKQGYEYLDGVTLSRNNPLAKKNSNNYYSGRYKMTVDARDSSHLYIKLERSLDRGNNWSTIINQFDAKDSRYKQGATPDYVRYAITGSTGGANNIHEIGWIRLRGNCLSGSVQSYKTGPFDAWDTNRNISDRNISTKIVNTSFSLTLASINASQTALETKNGATQIYYGLIKPKAGKPKEYEYIVSPLDNPPINFEVHSLRNKSFNVSSAVANAKAVFRFCADYNGTAYMLYPNTKCSNIDPHNVTPDSTINAIGWRETFSSDSFAVRPDHFTIDINTSIIRAGETFPLIIHAVDGKGNDVLNYNESINIRGVSSLPLSYLPNHLNEPINIGGASPSLNYSESNTNCITGTLKKVHGSFVNGRAKIDLTYSEIGNLKLLLSEQSNTDFAYVDFDDTDFNQTTHDSQNYWGTIYRQIGSAVVNRSFIPHHFEVTNVKLHDHHETTDINFTYLAANESLYRIHDQINTFMTALLELNVTAAAKQKTTTKNYNAGCYANNLTHFTIGYQINNTTPTSINPGNLSSILYRWYDDSSLVNGGNRSATLGSSVVIASPSSNIPKSVFNTDHNGSALLGVQLNFDRAYNAPVNPFKFHITDLNISDGDTEDNNNSISPSHDATFLYARIKPTKYLYTDTKNSIKTPIMIQVYCSKWISTTNCPGIDLTAATNDYRWFISTSHDMQTKNDGNITLELGTPNPTNSTITINDTTPQINTTSKGIDSNINITGVAPVSASIGLKTNLPTDTNLWLIYNKDNDDIPTSLYRVRFLKTGHWTGEGKTGHVVGDDINTKKTERLDW